MKGKILVVDDEMYTRHVLDIALEHAGYNVRTARTAQEAACRIAEERFDCIVLDLLTPDADGFEACRLFSTHPLSKDIPIILMHAKGRNSGIKLGFEAGADDFLTKPFSPNQLVKKIEIVLAERARIKQANAGSCYNNDILSWMP